MVLLYFPLPRWQFCWSFLCILKINLTFLNVLIKSFCFETIKRFIKGTLCLILCDSRDYSTPVFSILLCLPEFAHDSCPLSWWCYPTISSSVVAFSTCPQSFPASGSFPVSWVFVSGSQSIGTSASGTVLPMNFQGWFPLGLTIWSSCCPGDSQRSSQAPQFKSISSSVLSLLYGPTLTSVHDYWKNHNLGYPN